MQHAIYLGWAELSRGTNEQEVHLTAGCRVGTCDAASIWTRREESVALLQYCSSDLLMNSVSPQLTSTGHDTTGVTLICQQRECEVFVKEETESAWRSSGSHLSALPTVTWQMCSEAKCTTAACSKSGLPFSPLPLSSCGVQCQPCWNHHSLSWYVFTSHTALLHFIFLSIGPLFLWKWVRNWLTLPPLFTELLFFMRSFV